MTWDMTGPWLTIVLASLSAGLTAGFVMHRSDFCVTAMFRDLFLFRDAYLLRMLVLLVVVSMLLFELARWSGRLTPYPFPLLGPPSAASMVGGFLFGIGMVLAGGCVVGTLYKLGAGSVASGVAFLGMLAGSALYAEFHPVWSDFAKAAQIEARAITLPQWLGLPPSALILPAAALGAVLLLRWYRAGALTRISHAAGHLPPWQAALILAGVGLFSYLLVGMPLGITTSYAKLGATIETWLWPEHVAGLAYFSSQPLHYTPPLADRPIQGGPGPGLDAIAAIQYPLIVGILLGACVSAVRVGEFRVRFGTPPRQLASALIGGILLGLSARMVPGCNIWHLWGGIPILALQSLLFVLGLVPGTWLGSRLLVRFVIR
ncbi:MAG: YeeE/YedE family protein [Myxococcales bacterium]|nr:YeeE/YedE family protein [Myxococcota bacterium]MDW8284420.1 YeeE/YedE family protein [Myxococcales bacterium]